MRRSRIYKRSPLEVNQEISKSIDASWLSVWVLGPFVVLPNFIAIFVYGSVLVWILFICSLGIVVQAIRRIRRLKRIRKQLHKNPDIATTLRIEAAPDFGTMFWFWR
jgi:Flp pilus assembly protein TadB